MKARRDDCSCLSFLNPFKKRAFFFLLYFACSMVCVIEKGLGWTVSFDRAWSYEAGAVWSASETDLINQGRSSFQTASVVAGSNGSSTLWLNDGAFDNFSGDTGTGFLSQSNTPTQYEVILDQPYNLSGMKVYSGGDWNQATQNFKLEYRRAGEIDYVTVFDSLSATGNNIPGASTAIRSTFSFSSGEIANADRIRLTFPSSTTSYREIDVFGTAASGTTPGPTPGQAPSTTVESDFETWGDLVKWQPDSGVSTSLSTDWATSGSRSLRMSVNPLEPWNGVRRQIGMEELRKHEFLELDLRAGTPLDYVVVMIRCAGFQEFMLVHDQMMSGELVKVRVRLPEMESVKFGDAAELSIWLSNRTNAVQVLHVDDIRLTGYAGAAARAAELLPKIDASGIAGPEVNQLRAEIVAALAATVSDQQAASFVQTYSEILRNALVESGNDPLALTVETTLRKLKKSDALADLENPLAGASLQLALARREYETRQLIVASTGNANVDAIAIGAGPLTGPGGARIESSEIEIRLVEEINIAGTTQYPGPLLGGNWPDPLLPNAPFSLAPGRLQSLWVTVHTAANTRPGTYTGALGVSIGGSLFRTIPVNVTVRNFELPEKDSLKTMFNGFSHNWANFYRYAAFPDWSWFIDPSFQTIPKDKYLAGIEFFRRYRISMNWQNTEGFSHGAIRPPVSQSDGSINFTVPSPQSMASWDETAEKVLEGGINFSAAQIGGQTKLHLGSTGQDNAVLSSFTNYLEALNTHLAGKSWDASKYAILMDEPDRQASLGGWDAVRAEARLIKTTAPALKTFVASGVTLPFPGQESAYSDVDAFAMLWDRTPSRVAKGLRAQGKEVWWYAANVVYAPYPNWAIHANAMASRVIPLMSFKEGMDGVLQWSVNLWGDKNTSPQNSTRWPQREWTMEDWFYQPGEGHLCYPGTHGEFWPSIRLANWRDGMEDYEYLVLLKNKLSEIAAPSRARADELISLSNVVTSPYDYTLSPQAVEQWRQDVARLLDELYPPAPTALFYENSWSYIIPAGVSLSGNDYYASTTDLANAGQSTLASAVWSGGSSGSYGSSPSQLNNGLYAAADLTDGGPSGYVNAASTETTLLATPNSTYTINFTGGMDVTSIDVYSAMTGVTRAKQNWKLEYRTVGGNSYLDSGMTLAQNSSGNRQGAFYNKVTLVSGPGELLNVESLRFTFLEPVHHEPSDGVNSSFLETAYREIDVFGAAASTPTYDGWAATNIGNQAANLDHDNDGVPNGVEYFMNAAPGFTANAALAGNTVTWPNGGNIPSSAYGSQYVVQRSNDLIDWEDVPKDNLDTNTSGPAGSLSYTVSGGGKQFVRLKVTPN